MGIRLWASSGDSVHGKWFRGRAAADPLSSALAFPLPPAAGVGPGDVLSAQPEPRAPTPGSQALQLPAGLRPARQGQPIHIPDQPLGTELLDSIPPASPYGHRAAEGQSPTRSFSPYPARCEQP